MKGIFNREPCELREQASGPGRKVLTADCADDPDGRENPKFDSQHSSTFQRPTFKAGSTRGGKSIDLAVELVVVRFKFHQQGRGAGGGKQRTEDSRLRTEDGVLVDRGTRAERQKGKLNGLRGDHAGLVLPARTSGRRAMGGWTRVSDLPGARRNRKFQKWLLHRQDHPT